MSPSRLLSPSLLGPLVPADTSVDRNATKRSINIALQPALPFGGGGGGVLAHSGPFTVSSFSFPSSFPPPSSSSSSSSALPLTNDSDPAECNGAYEQDASAGLPSPPDYVDRLAGPALVTTATSTCTHPSPWTPGTAPLLRAIVPLPVRPRGPCPIVSSKSASASASIHEVDGSTAHAITTTTTTTCTLAVSMHASTRRSRRSSRCGQGRNHHVIRTAAKAPQFSAPVTSNMDSSPDLYHCGDVDVDGGASDDDDGECYEGEEGSGSDSASRNVSYESITAARGLCAWSFEELRAECYAQSLIARGTKPPPAIQPSLAIPPAFVPHVVRLPRT